MLVLEDFFLRINRHVSPLKESWREWIAKNMWWIALGVAVITSLIFIATVVLLFMLQYAIRSLLFEAYHAGGWLFLVLFALNTILTLIGIVLLFVSVWPLRGRRLKGWKLLYAAIVCNIGANVVLPLVNAALTVIFLRGLIGHSITFDGISFAGDILLSLVFLYLAFQIREKFQIGEV